jgi:hypothetical protein
MYLNKKPDVQEVVLSYLALQVVHHPLGAALERRQQKPVNPV